MRGEPPPRLQDDYWALGVLSPWRMEDAMRQARTGEGRDGFDPEGGFTSRRGGKKTKWDRMPVLWEWEVRDELERGGEGKRGGEGGGEWREKGFEGAMVGIILLWLCCGSCVYVCCRATSCRDMSHTGN